MEGKKYLFGLQNKKLNDVVIPGAHDAGIYVDTASNVLTQVANVKKQAKAGCRFFDIRVGAHMRNGVAVNQTYHGDFIPTTSKVKNQGDITQTKRPFVLPIKGGGDWGGEFVEILRHAKEFVSKEKSEFLILRISKSSNYLSIIQDCANELGDKWYTKIGNLNNKLVSELAGFVITVFDEDHRKYIDPAIRDFVNRSTAHLGHGVLYIRNLFDKNGNHKPYEPHFSGMQYFGKYSDTKTTFFNSNKVKANTKRQAKRLLEGSATHIDAIGMMYWTTTGLVGDIQARNELMWSDSNVRALRETWEGGLQAAISDRMGREMTNVMKLAQSTGGVVGGRLKAFMPNIVMMDFVDSDKCKVIHELNTVAAINLQQLVVPKPVGPLGRAPDPTGSANSLTRLRRMQRA